MPVSSKDSADDRSTEAERQYDELNNLKLAGRLEVRRATVDDIEAIGLFIKSHWGDQSRFRWPERWEWEFRENPYRSPDQIPIWLALDGDKVVGQTCGMMSPLKIGDEIYHAAWSVRTLVDANYRGLGLGYRLQEALHQGYPVCMSLSMSRANRRIKARLGARPVDKVRVWVKRLRYSPKAVIEGAVARSPSTVRGISRLAMRLGGGRVASWALNRRLTVGAGESACGLEIEETDRFGDEMNVLWQQVSEHFPVAVVRDAQYMNWKFVQQPHMDHRRFAVRRAGRPSGVLVLRMPENPEPPNGIISDLIASPFDAESITCLLTFAVRYFDSAGLERITAATTIPAYEGALAALGFQKRSEVTPMFYAGPEVSDASPAFESGAWLLSKGDHDWDQFPTSVAPTLQHDSRIKSSDTPN